MKCRQTKAFHSFIICAFKEKKKRKAVFLNLSASVSATRTCWDPSNLESRDALKCVCSLMNLDSKRQKKGCLFRSHRLQSGAHQQSGGAAPDRNIRWRPWTVFMESSCESAAASFLPLMNEISHAAPLQAAAYPGGRALSLDLPFMPSNTLSAFVNSWRTFWAQTGH